MQATWFVVLRSILEVLYFIAGIAIAGLAYRGLEQLRITKQIASTNAKREAIKLAVEQCRYFAEKILQERLSFVNSYKELRLTFLSPDPTFIIKDGEITELNFNAQAMIKEINSINIVYVGLMNALEAFAIPFVARVADDELGYTETAYAFLEVARPCMPGIDLLRKTNSGKFESILKLYETWNKRVDAEKMVPALKHMQEAIAAAEKSKIKAIGVD